MGWVLEHKEAHTAMVLLQGTALTARHSSAITLAMHLASKCSSSHSQVMADVQDVIDAKRKKHAGKATA